jgi:hypothetical protein
MPVSYPPAEPSMIKRYDSLRHHARQFGVEIILLAIVVLPLLAAVVRLLSK